MMPASDFNLKLEGVPGESKTAAHEGEIDVVGIDWGASREISSRVGSGRSKSRADVGTLNLQKFYDASSPYLALACMQGKSFDEAVISAHRDTGGTHLDYLVITLTNVTIAEYQMEKEGKEEPDDPRICDYVGLTFEKIKMTYTVQADDHSAGDEHEITFDVAAGV